MRRTAWGLVLAIGLALALSAAAARADGRPASKEGAAMAFIVTSPAFAAGSAIPARHTCDGQDLSPELRWTDPPAETRALALIVDDPDAPVGNWVHWVLYGLSPTLRSLPEGIPADRALASPEGAKQGVNDFRKIGWGGPCPPQGKPHRYFFKLFALDAPLGLEAGASSADLERAMKGHVLAKAELVGTYGRK